MHPLKGTCLAQTFTSSVAIQFIFHSRPSSIQLICSSCLSVCPSGETSHIYTHICWKFLTSSHSVSSKCSNIFWQFHLGVFFFFHWGFCHSRSCSTATYKSKLIFQQSVSQLNPAEQSSVCCWRGLNCKLQCSSLPPGVSSGTTTFGWHPNFQEMCRKCRRNECRALTNGSVHIHMHMRRTA